MRIKKNPNFGTHNTSRRPGKIEYIAIHYVGATGDAENNIEYYNRKTTTNASADFFVGHKGDAWQYNTDLKGRYCWAVGGKKQSKHGGTFYGKAKNANCISVEMCVKTKGDKVANSPDWYFTDATIKSTIDLVKYLMKEFDIPADRVIRHYDVNGKYCPGVVGWNAASGSEKAWDDFKSKIAGASKGVPFKVRVKIDDLNIRKGAGYKKYASVGKCPPGVYTIIETKTAEGYTWGRLKSKAGWIALEHTERL